MSELVSFLHDIVRVEYSQWMRYAYLSALNYGPFGDALVEHLIEHGEDELEHASIISRWIVDLGGLPPTDMKPIESFDGDVEGALNLLIEAEIDGINRYQLAHEMADGILGLQNDIGELLSEEHEHLSDLMKWLGSRDEETDPIIVVLAHSYQKFASSNSYSKFANVHKHAQNIKDYLKDMLEMAWYKHELDYTYDKGKQYITEDTQRMVESLWERHQAGEDVRDALQFYTNLYKWITPLTNDQWTSLHNQIWPEYHEWLSSDVRMEMEKEKKEQVPFKQTIEKVEPELAKPRQPKAPVELGKMQKIKEFLGEPGEVEKPRRPIEEEMKIVVYDAGKSRSGEEPVFEVGVGDKIKNMTLAGEDVPPPGRPGRSKYNEGEIMEVTPDGTVKVVTGVGEQIWDPTEDLIEIDMRERAKYLSR